MAGQAPPPLNDDNRYDEKRYDEKCLPMHQCPFIGPLYDKSRLHDFDQMCVMQNAVEKVERLLFGNAAEGT